MNTKTKEDYRDFAIAYVGNGNNATKAAESCGLDKSNASRLMKYQAVQEAIIEARMQLAEITGCTKESIIGMIQDIYRDLDRPSLIESASDAARLADIRLKCLDRLIEICGHKATATTQHLQVSGTSSELAKIIESTLS